MKAADTSVRLLLLLCLLCALEHSEAAKCVVSKWAEWSKCFGNCDMAQRVRNRDVYRPPFPERRSNGDILFRECPPLYEVAECLPKGCKKPKVTTPTTTLSPVDKEFRENPGNLVNFFPFR
ncbi:hypothetical protein QR680_016835 [Steinernema hermaphroditum]|uniref:Uncharacterized protein n=1 Tax=Steinernema hermaphroditum TaxID=289476 RepID=A0AA39HCF0_9BILA|nr:hypothetical protein QR680_016835 [Steinernema hermaphroditum]